MKQTATQKSFRRISRWYHMDPQRDSILDGRGKLKKKEIENPYELDRDREKSVPYAKNRLGSEIGWTTNYYYSKHGDVRREEVLISFNSFTIFNCFLTFFLQFSIISFE